ncbi:MAG TPA: hypothetical protein VFK50_00575 [Sphingomicrobium sp.]|nr:hypothetical protein [Sphingomicrobium sp.]
MSRVAIPSGRSALRDRLTLPLVITVAAFLLSSRDAIFDDGDVSWHIATGRWILRHGIPTADPFSHTMAGHPWVAHEWLPDIIFGAAFNLAGYGGVAAIVALALLALFAILGIALRRQVAPATLVVATLAMVIVLSPFLFARPHVLVWPLLAGWTAMLLRYRDSGRAPPLPAALLMTLWTNMHGSFPLGLAIAGAVALDALIVAGWARPLLIRWLWFGLASTLAALLNANGIDGLTYPFATLGMQTLPAIQEWNPSSPADTPWFYAAFIAVIALALHRGIRLRPGELLLLLFLLAMAFIQVRHQSWLAIVAALILPPRMAGPRPTVEAQSTSGMSAKAIIIIGFAASAFLLVALRLLFPVVPADTGSNPRTALAQVPPALRARPVFNEYSFGGPLILAGIRPFIDGRADMYGDHFFRDYLAILGGEPELFDKAVERYRIAWTMLPPGSALARRLDRSPDWRRVHADRSAVIHARTGGAAS